MLKTEERERAIQHYPTHRCLRIEACTSRFVYVKARAAVKRGREKEKRSRDSEREREKFGGGEAHGRRRGEVQRGSERPREALEVGRR
jgi:hypothetical protein